MSNKLTIASTNPETMIQVSLMAIRQGVPFEYTYESRYLYDNHIYHCLTAKDREGYQALEDALVEVFKKDDE